MARRKIPEKLDETGLWDCALRLLTRRAYSSRELERKLTVRAASSSAVDTTMNKLREYGFVDDRKFSEAFAGSRLQNQGFGRLRVLQELRSRRVAPGTAAKAIEKVFADTDELRLIQNFLDRKYRGKDLAQFLQEEKNLASAYRRLRTAGFSSSGSITILKRYSRKADDWDTTAES